MSRPLDAVLTAGWAVLGSRDPEAIRTACRKDLFFLLRFMCKRADLEYQWLLDRCDEVMASPDGHLDLWSRDHYKSSIITFGKTLQDILIDPEITIGIFSHTRPAAKAFLRQIKRECEQNELLKDMWPDVLWDEPMKEAPGWSEDNGLVFRRSGNPKEGTLEAWGLVDGQPTGKHFKMRVYDDVVTRDSANSEDMRRSTLEAWELSLALGTRDGKARYIGTRYHFADVYQVMMNRKSVNVRIWPVVDATGKPHLLTQEQMARKKADMGPVTWAAQMMLNPLAESSISFKREWLRFYRDPGKLQGNIYVLVDPANAKSKKSDYTAVWVVCLSDDGNYYVLDIVRDRLNLLERCKLVFGLHKMWKPRKVVYEEYGIMNDRQTLQMVMDQENYRFEVTPVGIKGPWGKRSKTDRIQDLIQLFANSKIYLPDTLTRTVQDTGLPTDMVQTFIEDEYCGWPFVAHDDLLDCLVRIKDPQAGLEFPRLDRPAWFGDAKRSLVAVGTGEVANW
jgi:phage terminase large subunit-like protein